MGERGWLKENNYIWNLSNGDIFWINILIEVSHKDFYDSRYEVVKKIQNFELFLILKL